MGVREERWGTDLRLLGNLERQNDRDRGRDLFTARRPATGLVDLETVTGVDNLSQALLLRFLTPLGEMEILGHPSYGSRLFQLIGELNIVRTHNLAKMFVLQALAEEPRVKQVVSVEVHASRTVPTQMNIDVHLLPVDSDTALNLVFPFFLQP